MTKRRNPFTGKNCGIGRRGDIVLSHTANVILIAVGAIAAVLVVGYVFLHSQQKFGEDSCKASLLAAQATDVRGPLCTVAVSDVVPIKCDRSFVTVTDSNVRVDGRDITSSYSSTCPDGKDGCRAQRVVAEQMRGCWREFLEGKKLVFQKLEKGYIDALTSTEGSACFVCSEITLRTSSDAKEFTPYLRTATMTGSKKTYERYFSDTAWCRVDYRKKDSCYEGYAAEKEISDNGVQVLKKDTTYAVVFIREGFEDCSKETANMNLEDSNLPTLTVQVVPAQDIGTYCDTVLV